MESTERKTVNLLVIATGKYTQFLEGLLDSAQRFFLKDCDVKYCVFTDKIPTVFNIFQGKYDWADFYSAQGKISCYEIEHKPFPFPTLHRFHFFKQHKDNLPVADYFFYIDVDCLFKAPITEEILSDRIAVQHCGYVGERGTYETRPESFACVCDHEGIMYFGGGFWGFSQEDDEFWDFVDAAIEIIDADEQNGIVPIWHDESVLNRYLIDNPPTKILNPSYHYPQNHPHIWNKWKKKGLTFEPIILLLDKNHKEIRK